MFMREITYRQADGSLLWLALGTRPDISYAVGQVAKFNANPGPVHWTAVLRIFRYLKFTGPMGIVYKYSVSNIDNQLVMFRAANDVGVLVILSRLDIQMRTLQGILTLVVLLLVLFSC